MEAGRVKLPRVVPPPSPRKSSSLCPLSSPFPRPVPPSSDRMRPTFLIVPLLKYTLINIHCARYLSLWNSLRIECSPSSARLSPPNEKENLSSTNPRVNRVSRCQLKPNATIFSLLVIIFWIIAPSPSLREKSLLARRGRANYSNQLIPEGRKTRCQCRWLGSRGLERVEIGLRLLRGMWRAARLKSMQTGSKLCKAMLIRR